MQGENYKEFLLRGCREMSDAFVQSPRIRARLLPQCRRGPLLIPVPTINRRGFSWPASIYRSVLDQSHRRPRSLLGVESPDIIRLQPEKPKTAGPTSATKTQDC
jgi:hypothetical protein